jgi:organic radical activating enzyme
MRKSCSEHGRFESVVETDPVFYLQCLSANAQTIYPGYLLDATQRCNIKCKYCYYKVDTKDPSIENIIQEAATYADLGPIIITGGEPTLRDDLTEVFDKLKKMGVATALLTNGTKLTGDLIDRLIPRMRFKYGNTSFINLSIHPESNGKDLEVIELMRERSIKLESVLFVIDALDQLDSVIEFGNDHKDVVSQVRIKIASKLWAEQKPEDSFYVSDVLRYLSKKYPFAVRWDLPNKSRFFNISINGMHYMIIHWYDISNIDILDKSCPPFYKARNGMVEGLNVSALVNEGMDKGFLDGKRI